MKKVLVGSALALLLWVANAPVLAQGSPPPKPKQQTKLTGLEAEWNTLNQDHRTALTKFYEPYNKAKTEEERAKIQLDYTKFPSLEFLPKFQSLAKRAKGKEIGAKALLWVVQNGQSPEGGNNKPVLEAIKSLMADYIQSPVMEQLAAYLRYSYNIGAKTTSEALRKILAESKIRKVQAAALFHLGSLLMSDQKGESSEVKSLFERLQKEYSDTRYAKQAEGSIFEMENLQIGKTAPEMEGTDHEGKTFKLSEYKGKVVVLDFWGFW